MTFGRYVESIELPNRSPYRKYHLPFCSFVELALPTCNRYSVWVHIAFWVTVACRREKPMFFEAKVTEKNIKLEMCNLLTAVDLLCEFVH